MEDSIHFWIDGSVQPVFFVIDADRLLINRNPIRIFTVSWL